MSGAEKVTLNDALSNVDVLDELPLPDEQPCIEVDLFIYSLCITLLQRFQLYSMYRYRYPCDHTH